VNRIQKGQWAQGALSSVILEYVKSFESMEDDYLRERAVDVKDLGLRILSYLQRLDVVEKDFPEHTVLVTEELNTSMLEAIPRERLVGIVSIRGAGHSHAAILARSMGIPAVVGVNGL